MCSGDILTQAPATGPGLLDTAVLLSSHHASFHTAHGSSCSGPGLVQAGVQGIQPDWVPLFLPSSRANGFGKGPKCGGPRPFPENWASLESRSVTLLPITAMRIAGPKTGQEGAGH